MAGKSSGRTRACGVGGTFPDLDTALLWARIGQDVTGGSWLIVRDGDSFRVFSPTEQNRELQPA